MRAVTKSPIESSSEKSKPTKRQGKEPQSVVSSGTTNAVPVKQLRMYKLFDCDFIIAFGLIDAVNLWAETYQRSPNEYSLAELDPEELSPADELDVWIDDNGKVCEPFCGRLARKTVAEWLSAGRGFFSSTEY